MASASNVQILPSSSSDLSSHISESPWEYEVFLSFRGEDTRYTFTERLYDALVERGIVTFKDDEELEIAKPISPELICAIKKSRTAVVVLSRNYASSTWCLQEVVEIVECVKERGMKIFHIFYHVDPSNVRHQRETFADAFVEHDKRFKENIEKVRAWRGALTKVANHSGYSLKDGSESKHIQTIVGKISCELDGTLSGVDKDNLVGMDSLVEKMLAQSVFKRIRSQFQASSFLDNVRMEHEKHGSATLQQQLIDMKLKSEKDKAYVCNNIMAIKILLKCSYTFSTLIHCSCLSNELHLMEWYEYPLRSIPRGFQPVKLVELIMPRSRFERLPMRFTNLKRLKLLDLSDSRNLILTPDFTGFPNLEKLILQGCTRLEKVDPSVGALERLILLNLRDCKCLSSFPHEINLKSLEILILSGCSRLKNFPEIGQNMIYLSKLYLDGTAIEELPSSIEHLTNLALLNLRDCKSFLSFPRVLFGLASLKSLILSGCRCQPTKSGHPLGLSPILSPIDVRLNFVQLISFSVLYYLILPNTYLRILTCVALILWTHFLCVARQHESKLINLLLPRSFSGLSYVVSLDLSDCNLLDGAFPDDLSCLSSLQSLNLSRNGFICLPNSISQLSKLKFLCLDNCTKLKSLQNLPVSTQLVMARECSSLENYSGQVVVWTSGEAGFTFINCLSLADDEECKVGEVFLLDSQV